MRYAAERWVGIILVTGCNNRGSCRIGRWRYNASAQAQAVVQSDQSSMFGLGDMGALRELASESSVFDDEMDLPGKTPYQVRIVDLSRSTLLAEPQDTDTINNDFSVVRPERPFAISGGALRSFETRNKSCPAAVVQRD